METIGLPRSPSHYKGEGRDGKRRKELGIVGRGREGREQVRVGREEKGNGRMGREGMGREGAEGERG